jgi:CIC family chloride channel protein
MKFVPTSRGLLSLSLITIVVGVITGFGSILFRGLHFMEASFLRIRNPYLRHAIGMLLVGALGYGFLRLAGHYYVEGVGYATIQDVLLGQLGAAPLLATLFFAKLIATTLSLGSGSSGGFFRLRYSWARCSAARSARLPIGFTHRPTSMWLPLRSSAWPPWLARA